MEVAVINKAINLTCTTRLPDSDINELEKPLSAKKISSCSDNDIKDALKYIMLIVGIRASTISAITDIEKAVLVDFIRKNYSQHTIEEFRLAFKKAIVGELDVDAVAYEHISCQYIGKIMKAYRTWAANYYRESGLERKAVNDEIISLPPSKYDPADWVRECFKDFLEGGLNIELLPERVYDIAIESGLLSLSDEKKVWCLKLSRQHVFNFYSEEIKKINPQKKLGEYKSAVDKLEKLKQLKGWDITKEPYVNRYAKAVALREYFYELKNNNQNQIICLCLLKPNVNT